MFYMAKKAMWPFATFSVVLRNHRQTSSITTKDNYSPSICPYSNFFMLFTSGWYGSGTSSLRHFNCLSVNLSVYSDTSVLKYIHVIRARIRDNLDDNAAPVRLQDGSARCWKSTLVAGPWYGLLYGAWSKIDKTMISLECGVNKIQYTFQYTFVPYAWCKGPVRLEPVKSSYWATSSY